MQRLAAPNPPFSFPNDKRAVPIRDSAQPVDLVSHAISIGSNSPSILERSQNMCYTGQKKATHRTKYNEQGKESSVHGFVTEPRDMFFRCLLPKCGVYQHFPRQSPSLLPWLTAWNDPCCYSDACRCVPPNRDC